MTQAAPSNPQVSKKNKTALLLLVVVFVLPVILAKLALDNGWFTKASTNKGELLQPVLDFTPISGEQFDKWRLTYVLPANCTQQCENALYSIQQVWAALGKKADRAKPLVVVTEQSDQGKYQVLQQRAQLALLTTRQQNVNQVFQAHAANGIFLVDTQNNVVLRYQIPLEKQQAVMQSREVLSDLRKLLKLSRIG